MSVSHQGAEPGVIAWIDGHWGSPTALGVPIQDRGLRLADGLFETVLVQAGRPLLLEAHLQRWRASAALLAMAEPPRATLLEPLIREAIERVGLSEDHNRYGVLRLNWSRGNGVGRGIDLPVPSQPGDGEVAADGVGDHGHRFWLQLHPFMPSFGPQSAHISRHERRNSSSQLSHCKTFAYGQAIQARREAHEAGADEALLLSSTGDLCCGAVANLLVRSGGRWLTPPLSSGCLPGVMRGRALELGMAEEAELRWDGQLLLACPPAHGSSRGNTGHEQAVRGPWVLLNSLGCRPLSAVDGQHLPGLSADDAERFWRQLL